MSEEERQTIDLKYFDFQNKKDIKNIEIRTMGLLDVFGKIEIDVYYKNCTIKKYIIFSPIDTNKLKSLLEKDDLYEKVKMYIF